MPKRRTPPHPIDVAPGPVVRRLSELEVRAWIERWIAEFPADRRGIHADEYLWHVFSYRRYPSVEGDQARRAYEQHAAPEYVVLDNDRAEGLITSVRQTGCSCSDWIVAPTNLAWSAAFTHEDGWVGPFFAKGAGYAALDRANRDAMVKEAQRQAAKRRGWV